MAALFSAQTGQILVSLCFLKLSFLGLYTILEAQKYYDSYLEYPLRVIRKSFHLYSLCFYEPKSSLPDELVSH